MIGSSKKDTSSAAPASSAPAAPVSSSSVSEAKVNALLGKGSEFEGKLSFEGTVRIDGVMKGEIRSKDKLVIGQGARVEAEIEVGSAEISGEIEGNVTASSRLELKTPARIKGNITTPVLIIEEGVTFDGNCSMGDTKSSGSKPVASTPSSSSSGDSAKEN